jgi:glycosyltransferase involved in cell wall biosynthesis
MRIAQVAPLFEAVPPRLYGGTERIVSYLTEELAARGHDVTLFASGDSVTQAKLAPVRPKALRLDPNSLVSPIAAHLAMLDEVRRRSDEFDVIHFHLSHFQHFPFFEHCPEKTVTTPHGRLDYSDLAPTLARWPDFGFVSISMRQRKPLPAANWLGNIYHGLPLAQYPAIEPRGGDGEPYLAFLGRMSRAKRPDRAIAIARGCGMKLKMAAKIEAEDQVYYDQEIKQLVDGSAVEYIGEVDEAGKAEFLTNAAALLLPIDWPEPFGLVVIEAMAFGVPVIVWNEGAMPEIVDEGVSGFVVDTIDAAVARVADAERLDRRRIREVFERRFSATRMVDDYISIYESLARAGKAPPDRRHVYASQGSMNGGRHATGARTTT